MPRWRALLFVLIAALFATGTLARAMPAAAPPCHEDAGHHPQKDTPQNDRPEVLAVGCCAGCMPGSAVAEAAQLVQAPVHALPAPTTSQRLHGRSLSPELQPPRRLA
jgi:hypothetical protein